MWKPDLSNYTGPKYIALADALCDDIRKNRLKPVAIAEISEKLHSGSQSSRNISMIRPWDPIPIAPHVWLKLPSSVRESEAVMVLSRKGIDVTPGEYFSVGSGMMPSGLRLCLGQIKAFSDLEYVCRMIHKYFFESSGPPGFHL